MVCPSDAFASCEKGRRAIAGRFEGDREAFSAQFQKMMNDLEPYIQLWNKWGKKEVAAAEVAG